jgi:diaminohydroxyphosphoribosylaminopyrimidine deaminase / 5-amino-6-(5-phosphoribosylamino)uracil reductase
VRDSAAAPVIVVTGERAPADRVAALRAAGVDVAEVPGEDRPERLRAGMRALGERGIQSVLVEGGAELAAGLLDAGAVDRVAWFLAPMLIGGVAAPSAIGGAGAATLAAAPRLAALASEPVGADVLVTGRLHEPVGAP